MVSVLSVYRLELDPNNQCFFGSSSIPQIDYNNIRNRYIIFYSCNVSCILDVQNIDLYLRVLEGNIYYVYFQSY